MNKLLSVISFLLIILNVQGQVGIGTNNPNNSAILDLTSTSRGFLAPRMTTVERTAITSPIADGLLVYDTDKHSFWYYKNTVWKELNAGGSFGTEPNNTYFEDDGTLVMNGDATVYNDYVVQVSSASAGGNSPVFSLFRNVLVWQFQDNTSNSEDEIHLAIQLPHDWKEGSAIQPHLHWSPNTTAVGNVRWGLEYSWADFNSVLPVPVSIYGLSELVNNNQYKHIITDFPTITPSDTQNNISSILLIRLFRNSSHTDDDLAGDAALLSFDIHYESNTLGSRTPTSK